MIPTSRVSRLPLALTSRGEPLQLKETWRREAQRASLSQRVDLGTSTGTLQPGTLKGTLCCAFVLLFCGSKANKKGSLDSELQVGKI